ncbi:SAV_915 family protein [Mycobacterium sp. MUNTM1]
MFPRELAREEHDRTVKKSLAWQPGWQTAEQLEDDWREVHGWVATPPADVISRWNAVRQAEADYQRAQSTSGLHDVEIGTMAASEWWVPAHPLPGSASGFAIELCRPTDGDPLFVAFTSVRTLVAALGEYQPWLKLAQSTIEALSHGIFLVDPSPGVLPTIWTKDRVDLLKETLNVRL